MNTPNILCNLTDCSKETSSGLLGLEYCMLIPVTKSIMKNIALSQCQIRIQMGYKYNFSDVMLFSFNDSK